MAFQSSVETGFYIGTAALTATQVNPTTGATLGHNLESGGLKKEDVNIFGATPVTDHSKIQDVTRSILTGGDINRDRAVEEDLPFGANYPVQVDVGTFTAVSLTLGGFYNDDAKLFPEIMRAWFASGDRIAPRWFIKTFDDTGAYVASTFATKYVVFACTITSFKLMNETGKVQRFEAMIKSSGRVFENTVPTAQGYLL